MLENKPCWAVEEDLEHVWAVLDLSPGNRVGNRNPTVDSPVSLETGGENCLFFLQCLGMVEGEVCPCYLNNGLKCSS